MELLKINIGGKRRPLHFGVNQTILYCDTKGITVNDFDNDIKMIATGGGTGREVRLLLWTALVDGARLSKEEFDADELTVGDWIEDVDQDEMKKAMEQFVGQLTTEGSNSTTTGTTKKK